MSIMGKSRKNLTHAEIWDDSALLQSWEEALKEYKLYHSIHAKGERVEDVIKDLEEKGDGDAFPGAHGSSPLVDKNETVAGMDEDLEEGEFEEIPTDVGDLVNGTNGDHSTAPIQHEDMTPSNMSQPQPSSISVPTAALNAVNNDAMKNLMLSWYWAGYYTGLHEGQQQAAPSQNGNT